MACVRLCCQAIEDKDLEKRRTLKSVMKQVDRSFTVIFIVEMVIKQSAYGFKKYFTDAWCWLDFVIVAVFDPLIRSYYCNHSSIHTRTINIIRVWFVLQSKLLLSGPQMYSIRCDVSECVFGVWQFVALINFDVFFTFYTCRMNAVHNHKGETICTKPWKLLIVKRALVINLFRTYKTNTVYVRVKIREL